MQHIDLPKKSISSIVGAISLAGAVLLGTVGVPRVVLAEDGVLVLDARQLDSITASGFVYVADSVALATGLGTASALTDTTSTSTVNPTDAAALATGVATAPDGSNVSVSIVVFGENGTDALLVTSAGDTLAMDSSVIYSTADGSISESGQGIVAKGGALADGGDNLTLSSTDFQSETQQGTVAGAASSDGFSMQSPSEATSGLLYQPGDPDLAIKMQATGSGDTDGSASAVSGAELTLGGASVSLTSLGEAVGQDSQANSSQVVRMGGSGMIVRSIGTATSTSSDGATSISNISTTGVPTNAIRSTQRTIRLNGLSRSTSTAVINLK